MKRPIKIIVVGGNAAGPAAAAKAKRYNPNAEVLLFEASEHISTGTCEMPYVLSGDIDDFSKLVFYSPNSFQEEKGVKVFVRHFVEEIEPINKKIIVRDLNEEKILAHDYDKLILATGSKAKRLAGFDTSLKNIFSLKNINDLRKIEGYLQKNKVENAIIIGSGFIGIEMADAFCKRNINVKIIEKENRPLPTSDKEFSEEIVNLFKKNNVEFLGGINEIEPVITYENLIGVKTKDNYFKTDFVLVSIGFEPDTILAQSAKLELGKSGAIKVDRYLKTSDRFIFAAGDNVEIINAVNGKSEYIPLATHAYDLGHIAGENAAGGNIKYEPFVKNISVKMFDKYFAQVGLNTSEAIKNKFEIKESSAKARNLVEVMPGSEYVLGKILFEKDSGRIIGASFLGGREISGYADLISSLIKLKTPAAYLSKIDYNYTPPLSPFVNLLKILGKKIIKKRETN